MTPAASHPTGPPTGPLAAEAQQALVGRYCVTCHSDRAKAGGLTLAHFDATRHAEHGELTEKIISKLRAGMMPPAGAASPGSGVRRRDGRTSLESAMDAAAAAAPRPGWRPSSG